MNRAQRVLAFLEQRPNVWIRATAFEPIGGRQAWRTAISEARTIVEARGGKIENRCYLLVQSNASAAQWKASEYRYVPPVPASLFDVAS